MTTERDRRRARGAAPGDWPALSPERAFVVQFRAGTRMPEGRCAGRVEHVRSGEAARFESRDQLLAFIARLLDARQGGR
jgi:hypothetical protein